MKRKNILIAIGIAASVSVAILAMDEVKSFLQEYAHRTYDTVPLYVFSGVSVLFWAVAGRIAIAYLRKPFYHGKLTVNPLPAAAASVFILFGIIDFFLGNRQLLFNQMFHVITLCNLFCIFGRRKL